LIDVDTTSDEKLVAKVTFSSISPITTGAEEVMSFVTKSPPTIMVKGFYFACSGSSMGVVAGQISTKASDVNNSVTMSSDVEGSGSNNTTLWTLIGIGLAVSLTLVTVCVVAYQKSHKRMAEEHNYLSQPVPLVGMYWDSAANAPVYTGQGAKAEFFQRQVTARGNNADEEKDINAAHTDRVKDLWRAKFVNDSSSTLPPVTSPLGTELTAPSDIPGSKV